MAANSAAAAKPVTPLPMTRTSRISMGLMMTQGGTPCECRPVSYESRMLTTADDIPVEIVDLVRIEEIRSGDGATAERPFRDPAGRDVAPQNLRNAASVGIACPLNPPVRISLFRDGEIVGSQDGGAAKEPCSKRARDGILEDEISVP